MEKKLLNPYLLPGKHAAGNPIKTSHCSIYSIVNLIFMGIKKNKKIPDKNTCNLCTFALSNFNIS